MSSSLAVFRCEDEDRGEEDNREALFSKQRQVDRLTNMLSDKLSEFLSSSFPYSLKRVPSTHVGNLYKGPTEGTVSTEHLPLTFGLLSQMVNKHIIAFHYYNMVMGVEGKQQCSIPSKVAM